MGGAGGHTLFSLLPEPVETDAEQTGNRLSNKRCDRLLVCDETEDTSE